MDRTHLLLAAAALFAALAVVQLFRGGDPAPVDASTVTRGPDVGAPPSRTESAAPVEPVKDATPRRGVRIHGEVTDSHGRPIASVRVSVRGHPEEVVTNGSGAYELGLEPIGPELPTLRFSAVGYEDEFVELGKATGAEQELRLDVRLQPAPGGMVSGVLTTERGSPIPGETVHLDLVSEGVRYTAVSGPDGRFSIPGVAPASGYYLFVHPTSDHADFRQSVTVGDEGLSLDISLRSLTTERLVGRLVDAEGRPMPGLEMSIVSGQALGRELRTVTDAEGRFAIDDVPTGPLSFRGQSQEELVFGRMLLAPGSDGEVLIRADWGEAALRGRVIDDRGRPLAGAEVELSWFPAADVWRRSSRSTRTDGSGAFAFESLAEGIHRLDVHAAGYRELRLDHEVTRGQRTGLEVGLEPLREAG